jgi:hypothetical protein
MPVNSSLSRILAQSRNCYQQNGSFPLRDRLTVGPAVEIRAGSFYESCGVQGIETEQIAYFAASVIWRAAATGWRNKYGPELELGPYREELRLYLLGNAEFPENAALRVILGIAPRKEVLVASLPVPERWHGVRSFTFVIPGVIFTMMLGRHIPPDALKMAFMPSPERIICVSDAMYLNWLKAAQKVVTAAKPKGSLKSLHSRKQPD